MFSICSCKGITLVESMIAVFLTTVAVIGLMSMQDTSWRTAGRSDLMGRAVGLMQSELEQREFQIMRGGFPAPPLNFGESIQFNQNIQLTDVVGVEGNVTLNVVTTTTLVGTRRWLLNVRVMWPGPLPNSMTSSMIVTTQTST